ncbi:MAG TPA: LytTR family transcriptional regulator DNA-binding domain-containing protein [Chthonomonadaceae bacterium]|nr:LytTR family transcriptional regulator DNA-binding domain-containing protein [Chthonomonadaceae bacterium]
MITALLTDNEPQNRLHLRRLLEAAQVHVLGEAENAAAALQLAKELRPDLIFVDIQKPGLTEMQTASALNRLEKVPLLIFVTGGSEHAVAAFEHDALDYLLKPIAPDRLAKTLRRADARLTHAHRRQQDRKRDLLPAQDAPLRRLPIRKDYAVHLVRVEEIHCALAREKHVYVRTPNGEHRTCYTLAQLEKLLPEVFCRIHESCLVNLNLVEEMIFLGNHTYAVRISGGMQLPVGRSRYAELQRRLNLDTLVSP